MIVLSIDSATDSASCAVLSNEKMLGEITFNNKKQHSVVLMPIVDKLLKSLQLNINDIDGFIVSKGPGSFTGLRIGAATIKGLSQGTNKPFVGVSSLDALAYNMAYTDGIICPVLDALRGNVYTALYKFQGQELIKLSDYMVISIEELTELIKKQSNCVCFIGDALYKYKGEFSSRLPEAKFAPTHLNVVKASSLGELGMKILATGISDDIFSFAPFYLRKSQAEREYEQRKAKIND
jgi:tRNA threonylcarbamoyladenosine biosynthesis protein TsaB